MRRPALTAAAALAAVVALSFALAGCTGSTSTPAPAASSTAHAALTPLSAKYPRKLTAANAKTESVRIANQVQGLIAGTDIRNVDDKSRLVAKTTKAGSYYGVIRAVTLTAKFDATTQAQAMGKLMIAAGWTQRQESNKSGVYAVALTYDTADGTAILLLKADTTNAKIPAITILLESPDLPS